MKRIRFHLPVCVHEQSRIERNAHEVKAECFDDFKIARADVVLAILLHQLRGFVRTKAIGERRDERLLIGNIPAQHPGFEHEPVTKIASAKRDRFAG